VVALTEAVLRLWLAIILLDMHSWLLRTVLKQLLLHLNVGVFTEELNGPFLCRDSDFKLSRPQPEPPVLGTGWTLLLKTTSHGGPLCALCVWSWLLEKGNMG
jgi:hypothetical protein